MAKENKNRTFILRINEETMNALEKWAADEFRSVNGQILYILDQALKKNRRAKKSKDKEEENCPLRRNYLCATLCLCCNSACDFITPSYTKKTQRNTDL